MVGEDQGAYARLFCLEVLMTLGYLELHVLLLLLGEIHG
jgi:hypothetical protein